MVDNYFCYLCSTGQPHGIEEMVAVPFTPLAIPRHSSLHACGFLGLQKQ